MMDFFKLRRAHKPQTSDEEDKNENENENVDTPKTENAEPEDDDDDDFITNEVNRRLKELRRNSFMVLIPEESAPGDDDDDDGDDEQVVENDEQTYCDWRDVEAQGRQFWSGFNAVYDKYSQQMLFYDHHLRQFGSHIPSTSSPRSAPKKLVSSLRCLYLKKLDESRDETEHLHQPVADLFQDLETAYVAQLCLTWEVLHCQHTQLSQKISSQRESHVSYNHCAQQFQQFLVLLQRYIENEPFEQGLRPEIYARMRNVLPMLLQVPKVQGSDQKELEEEELPVLASDLLKVIESSILTFRLFVKMDKKSGSVRNLFGSQNQITTPLHQIQCSLQKKKLKVKELRKRTKNLKKQSWPTMPGDVDLLLGLIDVKVMNRVLRMERISKEQLFWCEEKMKKLDVNAGKLQRDPSIILFPCQQVDMNS